jgi:hypothetical protein
MPTMWIARSGFVQTEAGFFNQIAMFSVTGLALWTELVVVYGFGVTNPWF